MHALIIENHFFVASLIEDELRDLGYSSIEIVESEDEAIKAAAELIWLCIQGVSQCS